eukprot:TRINITY_DN15150_c0_g1_i2.p1 TRINITY_DN15150_c0_g1~~TRINITY_DN15150_c0_g1_i2.p1  ORF type:complete len:1850 (+),score=224.90 TRINITY_DN15150_c0_g1_i2:35-5584(+)
MAIARLHSNETAATRSRRGIGVDADQAPTDMSPAADALFKQVLEGIVDTALIDYGKVKDKSKGARAEKWSFTKACAKVDAELRKEAEATPGVGHYDPALPFSARTCRIPPPSKQKKSGNTKALGPGHYQVNEKAITKRSPSPVKMRQPTVSRKKPEEPQPGPGTYENLNKEKAASVTMGTAPRLPKERSATPGPGNYEHPNEKRSNGKWRDPKKKVKSKKVPDEPVPGPGAYVSEERKPLKEIPNGWGTSGTGRLETRNRDTSPGPGHYVAATVSEIEKGFSFGTSIKKVAAKSKVENKPGPGSYAPEVENKIKGDYSMAPRKDKKRTHSPGPGTYDTTEANDVTTLHFGTEPRKMKITDAALSEAPGPGAYDAAQGSPAQHGHVFGTAPKETKRRTKSPGPGAYDAKLPQEESTAPVIGTSKKIESIAKKNGVPGPGAYDAEAPKPVQSFTMPCASTGRKKAEPTKNPGPGAYDITEPEKPSTTLPWNGALTSRGLEPDLVALSSIPGPGAYDVEVREQVPAVLIGNATTGRQQVIASGTPGPGSYTIDQEGKRQGVMIGTAMRQQQEPANMNPGPGTYEALETSTTNAPTFGFSGRSVPKNDNPGPGHYEVEIQNNVPSVTFGTSRSHPEPESSAVPGPGAYTHVTEQGIAYSFGKDAPRATDSSNVPGPGAYEHIVQSRTQATVIGTEVRKKEAITETPGPGAYYQDEKKKGGFTMQGRQQEAVAEGPGPGDYDLPGGTAGAQTVMGTAVRSSAHVPDVPGPGAYDLQEERSNGVLIAGRLPDPRTSNTPGPGQYAAIVPDQTNAPVMGTARRGEIVQSSDIPGPGTYELVVPKDTTGGLMAERRDQQTTTEVPGPGAYMQVLADPSAKGVVIGTTQRVLHDINAVPGPGTYDSTVTAENGTAATITGRIAEPTRPNVPGPGAYDIVKLDSGPAFSAGTATRSESIHGTDVPGPGAYQHLDSNQGPAYSIGGRRLEEPTNRVPGPGTYTLQDAAPRATVVFGTEQRVKEAMVSDLGPGAYDVPNLSSGPAALVTSRSPAPQKTDVPGPGQYDAIIRSTAHDVVMGTATRPAAQATDTPGPGTYSLDMPHDEKAFSILGRLPDTRPDAIPGPGSYNVTVKDEGPNVKIGTAARGEDRMEDLPGPGAYDAMAKRKVVGGAMGKEDRKDPAAGASDVPGPGAYEAQGGNNLEGAVIGTESRGHIWLAGDTPGPGTYEPKELSEGVAAVIGDSARTKIQSSSVPGPGAYDVVVRDTKAEHVIGTAPRASEKIDSTPGPGTYAHEEKTLEHGVVIPKTGRTTERTSEVPGPGAYEVVPEHGPSVSIGAYEKVSVFGPANNVPGPGNYDLRSEPGGPKVTISTRLHEAPRLDGPGPGSYDLETGEAGPKVTIGKLLNEPLAAENPGPGHYCTVEETGPSITLGQRTTEPAGSSAPGPGHYNARMVVSEKAKGVTILGKVGKSSLDPSAEAVQQPGPGAYHNPKVIGSDVASFTIAEKLAELGVEHIAMPGPGHYHSEVTSMSIGNPGSRSVTLKMEGRRDPVFDVEPGPGTYHHEVQMGSNAPKVSILGRELTNVLQPGKKMPQGEIENPGPGAYHREVKLGDDAPKISIYGNNQKTVVQPGGKVMPGESQHPGPGAYHREVKLGDDAPKVSIYGKNQKAVVQPGGKVMPGESQHPGPGAYHREVQPGSSVPKVSMHGKYQKPIVQPGAKMQAGETGNPGPGSYKLPERAVRGPAMGRPPRPVKREENGPGPGSNYKAVPLGANAPSHTMAPRPKDKPVEPGLGYYDLKPPVGPSFTIGRKREPPKPDPTPAPNEYNAVPLQSSRAATGRFAMMTGRRAEYTADATPGPGEY